MFNPSQFNTVIHLSAHSMIPLKGNVNMWSSRTLLLNNKHGWNIKHCCSSPSRHCTLMRWHKINHHRLAILLSSTVSFDFSLSSMANCISSTITLPAAFFSPGAIDSSSSSMATCVWSITSLPIRCPPLPPLTIPHPRCLINHLIALRCRHWLFLMLDGGPRLINHLIANSLSSAAAIDYSSSSMFDQSPHCRIVVLCCCHWLFLILYGCLRLIHHLIVASLSSTAAFGLMSTANERYHTTLPNNG